LHLLGADESYPLTQLKLIDYSRAELKASDHRPVYAILETEVRLVDRLKKEAIKQEILESSEVSSLREALMMPLEAGKTTHVSQHPSALHCWLTFFCVSFFFFFFR
jgi:hypothetical protein